MPTIPTPLRAAAITLATLVPCAPGGLLYVSPLTHDVLSVVLRFAARSGWVDWMPASMTATRTPCPVAPNAHASGASTASRFHWNTEKGSPPGGMGRLATLGPAARALGAPEA